MFDLIFNIALPLLILIIGYVVGTILEKKHYKSIIQREAESSDIILISSKRAPAGATDGDLVLGSVVIASDTFKRFVAWLIGIFGGRLGAYESLLDRARREALLRMKEQARNHNANMIVNIKFETATLNDIKKKQGAMVEILAYGTAVKMPNN